MRGGAWVISRIARGFRRLVLSEAMQNQFAIGQLGEVRPRGVETTRRNARTYRTEVISWRLFGYFWLTITKS